MLFLMMCTSFCVLNYFSSRSLRLYFSLRFDMSMYRCVSFVRYFTALFTPLLYKALPGGASTNGLLYADAVRRGEA
jgi:hypothetical protein